MSLHSVATGDPSRPPVVFLHGLGVTSWMWDELVALLGDRYRCIAVDLPGQGGSHVEPWVSIDDAADRVAEVVAEVGPAHLVGLSLGGYVALALRRRRQDLVRSTVVSGVTISAPLPRWAQGVTVRAMTALLRSRLVARVSARLIRLPAEARARYVADVARLSPQTVERIYRELFDPRPDPIGSADGLLVVAGDREVRSVRRDLADLADRGVTAAVARRASHAWVAEHPELFARTVVDWIEHRTVTAELVVVGPAVPRPGSGRFTPRR